MLLKILNFKVELLNIFVQSELMLKISIALLHYSFTLNIKDIILNIKDVNNIEYFILDGWCWPCVFK